MTFQAFPVFTALLVTICLAAIWFDGKERRLPNWLCAVTAALGLTSAWFEAGLPALGSHALHMAIALLVGMTLFALRVFGGGDVKFYAGIAAWFALGQAMNLLISVALCGLALLIGWFTYRRLARLPISQSGSGSDALPYGIAIGLGAIAARLL